jgi:hypothetical protein
MSTSFTKEWSDDDSSHSSEEFMYVKGDVEKNDVQGTLFLPVYNEIKLKFKTFF